MPYNVIFRGKVVKTGFDNEDQAFHWKVNEAKRYAGVSHHDFKNEYVSPPSPVPQGGGYQVYTIGRGGGRTPKTLSVHKTFATEKEAKDYLSAERREFASRDTPVGIRPTPSTPAPGSFEYEGRTISGEYFGPPPKGRKTTRTPKEQMELAEKHRRLTLISQAKATGKITTKEAQRLREHPELGWKDIKPLRETKVAVFKEGAKRKEKVFSISELPEREQARIKREEAEARARHTFLKQRLAEFPYEKLKFETQEEARGAGYEIKEEIGVRKPQQLQDVLTGYGTPFILPEVTFKDKPSLLQRADIRVSEFLTGPSKKEVVEKEETVTFLEGLQQTFPENKFIGKIGDISVTGETISRGFIGGFGAELKERPVTLGFLGVVGFTFRVGKQALQTFSLGRKISKVGEGFLSGQAIGTTAAEIALAPDLEAKAEVVGRRTADFIAFGAGYGAASQTFAIARRPRFVDINLATGKVRAITSIGGVSKAREFDISRLLKPFGRKEKQPPVIFEDMTKPTPSSALQLPQQTIPSDVVKPIKPKPSTGWLEHAAITTTGITTKVLGAEVTLPALTIGLTTALGGLDISGVALVAGRSMRMTKKGKLVPRRRAEVPMKFPTRPQQEIRQLPQKHAARISRIERLGKQQQQLEKSRLFEEQRILKKGKQRIIETQKFQPFITLQKAPKGRIVETLTKIPKGPPKRIFYEKGKPLIVKESLGRIEIGQRPEVSPKKSLVHITKGGKISKISKIPTGRKAYPKGFGAQIERPIGDINKLVLITKGIVSVKRGLQCLI